MDLADFSRTEHLNNKAILESQSCHSLLCFQNLISEQFIQMVDFFLKEGRLWCLRNLNFDCLHTSFSPLRFSQSCLLLLNKVFSASNFLCSWRFWICSDDLVRQTFHLNLLNSHFCAIFKMEPKFGVTDSSILNKTLRDIVAIRNRLIACSNEHFLFDLVLCLVTRAQTKLKVVFNNDRL